MAGQYSQPPIRNVAGSTTDQPWQPLADSGFGNPFFYHQFADDFDFMVATTGAYTKTATGNGSAVHTAGDGGLITLTTNSTTPAGTDIVGLQLPVASFSLTAGKKLFYLTRLQLADVVNPALLCGLIQTTATPFTPTDGVYFSKASGSTQLYINSAVGSVITSVAIPASAVTLTNNVNVDLAFYLTRQGDILAFVGPQLVGYIPSSGTGALTPPTRGACARILGPTLTAAALNVTMAIQSGTASSKTMIADFHAALKER